MAERAEPEKRLFEVDPRGSPSPSTRGSLYRTHETGPLFSHRHLSPPLVPLSPTSCEIPPPRRQMYARGTRVCFAPSSLSVPWAPRVTPIKKDCLTIRRGSNIALEGALVLCSAGRLGEEARFLLSGHSSTTPDLFPLPAISFAMPVMFSHDAHDFISWIKMTTISSCPANLEIQAHFTLTLSVGRILIIW